MDSLWLYTALALLGAGVIALFIAQRRQQAQQQATLQTLQSDLRALCNAAVGVGERVNGLERRLRQLAQQQEELGLRQAQINQEEPEQRSYSQAIKMAQKGASVDDMVDVCNITRGEAELVAMMHRLGKE